jgi:hypothetical protein
MLTVESDFVARWHLVTQLRNPDNVSEVLCGCDRSSIRTSRRAEKTVTPRDV